MKLKISTDGRLTTPEGTTIELDGKPLLCESIVIKLERLDYLTFDITTIGAVDGRKVTSKMLLGMLPNQSLLDLARDIRPFHIECDVEYLTPKQEIMQRLERKVFQLEQQIKELKAKSEI